MKAALIRQYVPLNEIEVSSNAQNPTVQPGLILVEVFAAGVNPIDWKVCEGIARHRPHLSLPLILGVDFSGVVVEVGSEVNGFKPGDEVYGKSMIFYHGTGSFAEFMNVEPHSIAPKPKTLTHVEAAALPLAAVSAWQALVDITDLRQGQKVLIHGGAGGIGSFAIQIAKDLGAYVATTVSAGSMDYVHSLGADEVIDYHNQSFETLLHDYDAVLDNAGGVTALKSYAVLKKGGILVSMTEDPREELMTQYGVRAVHEFTDSNTARLREITKLVEQNKLKIHIDKVFPLDEAPQAIIYLKTGHPTGKVVIKMRDA